MAIGQFLGGLTEHAGNLLGIPELGISERIAGGPTPLTGGAQQPSSQQPILGATTQSAPQQPTNSALAASQTAPPVAGVTTGGTSGGGGGEPADSAFDKFRKMLADTGSLNPAQMEEFQKLLGEQQPSQPSEGDLMAAIQPGLDALTQTEEAQRQQNEADLASIESETESFTTGQQGELQRREAGFEQQRTRETGRVGEAIGEVQTEEKGAIAEARRSASELQRGIQARFGGTTGTGQFASELLGGQAVRGIAGVRQQAIKVAGDLRTRLQETIGQIDTETENVRSLVQQRVADAERQMISLKDQSRANLQNALAEIGQQRGALKAQTQLDAINQFRADTQAINARNAQFKQQAFLQAQQLLAQLGEFKQKTQTNFQTDVERQQLAMQKLGLNVTGATTSSTGRTTLTGSAGEEEDKEEDLFT